MAALSGVRVLDLSRVLAGPFCTALLADLGAEVIKVEQPGRGDDARSLGPFRGGESIYFAQLNRSKKSVAVNLRDPAGVELLGDLAGASDVLVENFRPGVAARLGIGYPALAARHPGLIYLSISGFGQTGPMTGAPAYDLVVQAMSGLMEGTGFPDGPPTRVGESVGDLVAGLFGAWAVSAALYERERTGRGTHLDAAMFECLVALQVTGLSLLQVTGRPPRRVGNRHPVSTPFDSYRAADGLVVIAVASEPMFERLAGLIGRPELPADARFASDELRTRHEETVRALIEDWTSVRTVEQVVAAASAAGVPASPIWDLQQAVESDQARERGLRTTIEHPRAGRVDVVRQPVRFGDRRPEPALASPALGEDTDDVLGSVLGLRPDRLDALRARRVI